MSSVCHYCTVRHEGCHGSGCEKWVEEAERKYEEKEIRTLIASVFGN